MHGVVMTPTSTPNEAVFFKNRYDSHRNAILITQSTRFIFAATVPLPVIGVRRIDVDGDSKRMGTQTVGSTDVSPIKGSANVC